MSEIKNQQDLEDLRELKELKDSYRKEMSEGNTRNGHNLYLKIVRLENKLGLPISMR